MFPNIQIEKKSGFLIALFYFEEQIKRENKNGF